MNLLAWFDEVIRQIPDIKPYTYTLVYFKFQEAYAKELTAMSVVWPIAIHLFIIKTDQSKAKGFLSLRLEVA